MTKKTRKAAYLFILPFVLFFAVFKLYPMLYGFVLSFMDKNSIKIEFTNFITDYLQQALSKAFLKNIE